MLLVLKSSEWSDGDGFCVDCKPHYLYPCLLTGDFAILLSSGMKWYVALMYNFLSAVTAIIGTFIGVAIGSSEEDATNWILAITAGIFLYVALVDLVELEHLFNLNYCGFFSCLHCWMCSVNLKTDDL